MWPGRAAAGRAPPSARSRPPAVLAEKYIRLLSTPLAVPCPGGGTAIPSLERTSVHNPERTDFSASTGGACRRPRPHELCWLRSSPTRRSRAPDGSGVVDLPGGCRPIADRAGGRTDFSASTPLQGDG